MAKHTELAKFPAKSQRFLNRELQLLSFNARVLAQAEDPTVPLLERLKFLAIVSSNLDEFFEIRVSGLKEQLRDEASARSNDGATREQTFAAIVATTHALVERQYALLNDELFPALVGAGIRFIRRSQWTPAQSMWIRDWFFREMMPVLTPIGLDPSHPFPRILNKSLNFAVALSGQDAFGREANRAIVQAPRVLPRVIRLPAELAAGDHNFVFLTSILHAHVGELFAGMEVLGCYQFRVTRNSDLFVDDEEVKDLRAALKGELPQRHLGDAVRLEVAENCSEEMVQYLLAQVDLTEADLYRVNGPVNLARLIDVPGMIARADLKYPPFAAGTPKELYAPGREKKPARTAKASNPARVVKDAKTNASPANIASSAESATTANIFEVLAERDVLLHHPFQSFTPVVDFLKAAARDPQVVAIKQTVYRTGTDSAIMETLIDAATRGKEVTVVVELMARFDEEANLNWAERLEAIGAHVVYGVVGHKTHAKMILVVRREVDAKTNKRVLRRYVHVGTGNYHPRTAKLYTDFGLLTSKPEIAADVNEVFTQLTGLGRASKLAQVWQSPFSLHEGVLKAIQHEARVAKTGKPARIIAKMNSLVAPTVIEALYRASKAGVKIDLIVRGVCALRPGVPGLSENIRVRSVVGQFLEHTRVFYFGNGGSRHGESQVWLSSADWMERNFFRRIELCVPVLDATLAKRVVDEGLKPYLADNTQAWEMGSDGRFTRQKTRSVKLRRSAQALLLAKLASSE